MENKASSFNYNEIPLGFYDDIARQKKGIRSFWHNQKFNRIIDSIGSEKKSILDIGCFSGTFLSFISKEQIQEQVGVDILKEQIDFANENYATDYRRFYFIKDVNEISFIEDNYFDYITIIEVIEHLNFQEIETIISMAYKKLKPGGKLILTTPNYSSLWPIQELILNRLSDVKYEEQHITHFTYFNVFEKLNQIVPNFNQQFKANYKTTTHFITPYIAILSYKLAQNLSKYMPHRKWTFPFGSLLLMEFEKITLVDEKIG